jgi:hypothetical protein
MSTAPRFGSDSRHERHVRSHRWSAGAARLRPIHGIIAALAFAIILPVAYVAYCMATLPENGGLVIEPTPSALIVEAPDGQVFATRGVFKGDKLSPQDIPANLSRAVIAIEDRHFYEHGGFYLPSMVRAAIRNIVFGSVREGGSTITQQLARIRNQAGAQCGDAAWNRGLHLRVNLCKDSRSTCRAVANRELSSQGERVRSSHSRCKIASA